MASIVVNFDSINGPEQSFNVYELDWAGLTALPFYSVRREATLQMVGIDDDVHYITFDSSGTNLSSLISQVPVDAPGDLNDLCNFDPTHTYAGDAYHLDYIYQDDHTTLNTSIVETMQIGVKPDDWGSNPHYFTLEDVSSSVDNARVLAAVPQSIEFEWNPLTQYYRDKSEKMVRILYLKNGYSFSCSKGMLEDYQDYKTYYGSASIGCTRFSGPFVQSSPENHYQKHYVLTYGSDITSYAAPTSGSFPYFATIHLGPANGGDYAPFQFFFHTVIDDKDHYGVLFVITNRYTNNIASIRGTMISDNFWKDNIDPQNRSWWGNDGPASIHQGGQGSFDAPSDNHGDRTGTDINSVITRVNSNMTPFSNGYNKYVMDRQNLAPFSEMISQLWDPSLFQSYENHTQNPLGAIISCNMLPENLAANEAGSSGKIKAAGATLSSTSAPKFDDVFKWYHVGDIDVSQYTDAFPDYSLTNVYIHLPYVGDFQIDTEAIMEGQLSVDYVVDMFTADITAFVWTQDRFGNKNYRYEFKGNCGKAMPLAQIIGAGAQRFGAIANAGLRAFGVAAGAVAANFFSQGPAVWKSSSGLNPFEFIKSMGEATAVELEGQSGNLVQKSAPSTMVAGIANAASAGASITQSNASGGSLTSLINDQCYLTISRPQWSAPSNYRKLFGYPSDCSGTIDEKFHGFLSVRSIRLEGVPATPAEKSEIEQLMRAGVYVDNIFEPEEQ